MLKNYRVKILYIVFLLVTINVRFFGQGTQVDFNTIPKSGTILVYSHLDDDLIWMLPFWNITQKFIAGAMPLTPSYHNIISQSQTVMNSGGYNISYEPNYYNNWDDITDTEYSQYYLSANSAYDYLSADHVEERQWNDLTPLSRTDINKMKAKLEQFFADPSMARAMTHNNWGEYGHRHHMAVNLAVRELAVKYRKDVWMLGCDNDKFVDVNVPNGITWAYGSFNQPDLYTSIRTVYQNNGRWTWYSDYVPSGDHKFIKIVDGGNDKSYILKGDEITYPGPSQIEPGSYIFDGDDDYLTLKGNNSRTFTIAMKIWPSEIKAMDVSAMSEYPSSTTNDRNIYIDNDGHLCARIYDGSSRTITSTSTIQANAWSHVAITGNGSYLKLYVNGILEGTISTGSAITNYTSPEIVLGQSTMTASCFHGQMNNVKVYDYVMSDSEVATLSGMVYTITSSAGSGGTISPSGSTTIVVGRNQTYTITPNTGYQISDVRVDNSSVGAVTTYTFNNVTANHTITVTFTSLPAYTITASAGSGGSINPSGDVTVYQGTSKTFSAVPGIGFKVLDMTVDNVSQGAIQSYTFTGINGNHTIAVTYTTTPTYSVTASAGTGGTISPDGASVFNEGSDHTFTISPGTGFRISDVTVDAVSVGNVATYTFSNITTDHTITASFTAIPTYTISASTNSGGSITPAGSTIIYQNASQTYTITPNTGYRISDVLVDNSSVGPVTTYTFNNVTHNHSIVVQFSNITFTISSSAETGGSISPSGTQTVNYGSSRTYTISPGTGYNISNVYVDGISIGAQTSFTFGNVVDDHTISASFVIITHSIDISYGTGGTISPTGSIDVNYGSSQSFAIAPNTGYNINNVLVDNVSMGAITAYTFNNVTADHTISASFTPITFTITATSGPDGQVTPAGATTVNYGSSRVYTITPNTGFQVNSVLVDNVSVGAVSSYTFTNVTASHTISATFKVATFTLTASGGSGGTISPSGSLTMNYGTSQTYNLTPGTGYKITDVKVDNVSVGAVTTYSFTNISANHTIEAVFSIIKFTLSIRSGTGGSVSPTGDISADYGSARTLTIAPSRGYSITDVVVDNVSQGAVTTYTFNNITANHTVSASFSILTYTVSCSSNTGGSVTPNGVTQVNYGSRLVCTITPDEGFKITDVKVDNISVGVVTSYIFNNITAVHTLSATFEPITFTITSSSDQGGSITPSGSSTVIYGDDQVYSITPDEGYDLSSLLVDHTSVGTSSTYEFNDVKGNHTIEASFTIKQFELNVDANAGGSVTPSGTTMVDWGTDVDYVFVPDSAYKVSDVLVDGVSIGAVRSYQCKDIRSDHNISVIFAPLSIFTITASSGIGGSITPSGSVALFEGSDQTYIIAPDKGYRVEKVLVDYDKVDSLNEYKFTNLSANHTIQAKFTTTIVAETYPNPFLEFFNLKISCPEDDEFSIRVTDISKRLIYIQDKIAGNTVVPVNINASPGLYFLEVYKGNKRIQVIKIVRS